MVADRYPREGRYNGSVPPPYTSTGPSCSGTQPTLGVVKSVKLGGIMAGVVIQGEFEIVSAITRGSAEAMDLKVGDQVKAIIKSTEVMVDKR